MTHPSPPTTSPDGSPAQVPLPAESLFARLQRLLRKHAKKLWWLHTTYALCLGAFVVVYAQKGFSHARWLALSLAAAWFLTVLFFRFFGSGRTRLDMEYAPRDGWIRFLVMTYVLKNLYQGMLFFLLPFYWKSSTFGTLNFIFAALLGLCAILSTLDIVFDNFLMRWKALATSFYGFTLFGCLNLLVPALLPNTRTLYTLLAAACITCVTFFAFHLPLSAFKKKKPLSILATSVVVSMLVCYFGRSVIPPVPMYLSRGAVGPTMLADGRLAMEVRALHKSVIEQVLAVTDVVVPGGKGDRLRHVWRHEGHVISTSPEDTSRVDGPAGTVRLRSKVTAKDIPENIAGTWSVDVETQDQQLVGRVVFVVTD